MTRAIPTDTPPEGFLYVPRLLDEAEAGALLATIRALEFHEFRMRGVAAKRRVRHYGWDYSFDGSGVSPGEPLPSFLLPARERAARVAGLAPASFEQALISRYPPGAGIGWHRDAKPFGPTVLGLSLGAPCTFKLRHRGDEKEPAVVFTARLLPGSAYVLGGEARRLWEHSIPAVREERYSITFRTLRRKASKSA